MSSHAEIRTSREIGTSLARLVPAPLRRCGAGPASQAGFGLVEVLVSALLVVLIGAAVGTALVAGASYTADQRDRTQAAELAQLDQERLKGLSAVQLTALAPPNQQVRTVTLEGTPYTITSGAQFLNSTGGSACGTTGAGAAAYYEVTSSVTWPSNRRSAVVVESLITPPAGGTLLTQVNDQTGAPLPGVAVAASASGLGAASGTTDSQGCAIFGGLATGDYTLSLTDAGYVNTDDQPANPLNISATVTSTGTATPSGGNPIVLGLAGTFNSNFTANSGALTGQQADSVSWYGTGTSDSMSNYEYQGLSCGSIGCAPAGDPCTPPGCAESSTGGTVPSSGTITLFPFECGSPVCSSPSYTNNYHVWAGPCRQQEPPSGTDDFTIGPGSSQALAIQEPALNIAVTYSGTQVKPNDIAFEFASTSGTSCTDKWTAPVASNAATAGANALADPGQPFASTATSGATESASGFTGTMSACADYTTAGHTRYATLTGLQNTNFTALPSLQTIAITNTSSTGSCASNF